MMPRTSGFSLIEMLAALAVLAIAGMALTHAMTTSIRAAGFSQQVSLAGLAADNLLALALAGEGGRSLRDRSGVYELADRRYDWRLEVEETADPQLLRVTVIVVRDQREQARRTTFVRRRP